MIISFESRSSDTDVACTRQTKSWMPRHRKTDAVKRSVRSPMVSKLRPISWQQKRSAPHICHADWESNEMFG